MNTFKISFLLLLFCDIINAQTHYTLQGDFSQVVNKEILLKGFTMTGDSLLVKTTTNEKGQFTMQYPASYIGAALLEIKDAKSVIIVLNHENFEMQWDNLEEFKTLEFKHSHENDVFGKGIEVAQKAENILSGLKYLKPLYEKEINQNKEEGNTGSKVRWLNEEIVLQDNAFPEFLKSLPDTSYVVYYLSLRKFLQDMPITASRYIERMPQHEQQFNNMNFLDERLFRSGLYRELLDGYFKLMESYGDLDKVYEHANGSVDAVLKSLQSNSEQQQDIAEYLFKLFEKRSLFSASEHLALAMLSSNSCQLDGEHQALFEQYRKMAKGNIAPELLFENTKTHCTKLSEIKNTYKLVIFGSSWCNKCAEEIPKIKSFYDKWKTEKDVEVVFISLDNDKGKYETFTKEFPWIFSCDFKGWEGKNARDYYVYGTPTMYLLDKENKILLKPISPEQINAWLEMR